MFNLFRKLFGFPTSEELAGNGQKFFQHLENLDDSELPLASLRTILDNEALGRFVRHAQRFPWTTDDALVTQWKSTVGGAISGYEFFVEYQVDSAQSDYLVFDVLRKPSSNPASFSLADSSAFAEKGRVGDDGEPYNYFMLNRPGDTGYALLYRIATRVTQGVLHVGTCRVYLGKRRQQALVDWDKEMSRAAVNKHKKAEERLVT